MKDNDNTWADCCIRTGCLGHIYGERNAPSIEKVELQTMTLNFGEETNVQLAFITEDVPKPMPEKWKMAGVNAVRIVLDLINICVNSFNVHGINMQTCSIDIAVRGGEYKELRISDSQGGCVINLLARYIGINSVSGIVIGDA